MIRTAFVLLFFSIVFLSCKKTDTFTGCAYTESSTVAPSSEVATLQAWITANRPTAIQHSSGLFYEIVAPGTGTVTPTVCSNVTVKYTGTLLNGVKFDENQVGVVFPLGGLILGWQKGLPLIKKGGTINLFIPPSLGYGNQAQGSIPANSYLIFSIILVDVV